MTKLKPFADDEAAQTIGELTVENGTERVVIYGSLEVTRDKAGLKRAKTLKAVLDGLVQALEAEKNLPERMASPEPEPTQQVKNPFE